MTSMHQPTSSMGGQGPSPYQQGGGYHQGAGPSQTSQQYGHYQGAAEYGHYPGAQQYEPYQGAAQYGYTPGAPMPGSYQEPRRRPVTVWLASLILWLMCLALLALGATAFVIRASVDWTPTVQGPPGIFDGLGTVLAGALVVIGAVAIASALVMGALTFGAFRGNNPCRWILVILAGLSLLQLVPTTIALVSNQVLDIPAQIWLIVAASGLGPALIMTLFLLPPSGAWYRYRSSLAAQARQQVR